MSTGEQAGAEKSIGGTGMSPGRLKLLAAMLVAMSVPMAYGQTVDHIASDNESTSDHESTHGSHKNVISIFAGVTHEGRRENGAALGVGYERLLSDSLAIGVLAEHTFGDADVWVYAVPFSYRFDRWKFYIAPGIEESDQHGTESLVRLSAEHAFEAGSWEISPQLAVDFVDGDEVLVLGVVFGWGF
jgi:hypothetical protein